MNPTTYQFLVEDHTRTLQGEADAARRAASLARQDSRAQSDGRNGSASVRFEIVRRLMARLATA